MKQSEIFGALLREIRNNQCLSQEKFSKITGLDRTFISLIETGKRNPTLTTFCKIADGLDLRPSQLMELFERKLENEPQSGDENAN